MFEQSDTIFTSLLQSPHSKQLKKQQIFQTNSFSYVDEQRARVRPDYESALEFADYIGLSPVSRIKKNTMTNVQRFFETTNLKCQPKNKSIQSSSSRHMIKNDIENRRLNFFDLKHIFQQRSNSLKLHRSKQMFKQKVFVLQNQNKLKQSRIMSARGFRENNSSFDIWNCSDEEEGPQDIKLRIQTAREISRKEKEKSRRNSEILKYIQKVEAQKSTRSKNLKDICKGDVQNPQNQNQINKNYGYTEIDQKRVLRFNFSKQQQKILKKVENNNKKIDFNKNHKNYQNQAQKNSLKKDLSNMKTTSKQQTLQLRFKKQTNRFEYSFKSRKN